MCRLSPYSLRNRRTSISGSSSSGQSRVSTGRGSGSSHSCRSVIKVICRRRTAYLVPLLQPEGSSVWGIVTTPDGVDTVASSV